MSAVAFVLVYLLSCKNVAVRSETRRKISISKFVPNEFVSAPQRNEYPEAIRRKERATDFRFEVLLDLVNSF